MNLGLVLQIAGIIVLLTGLTFSFIRREPTIYSYIKNIQGIFINLKGDNYFNKPRVELRPVKINSQNSNPEIGHDSEYELEIITPNPIAKFFLTVKVPDSVWRPEEPFALFNDTVTGDRAWYDFKVKNGYTTFEIPNATGIYHLVFGNTKPEQLTIRDLRW
ncbi:MAG: hypothetical protein WCV62_00965 [Candidatus Peribacteraceae bacterium]|jgi:hypothetical protein